MIPSPMTLSTLSSQRWTASIMRPRTGSRIFRAFFRSETCLQGSVQIAGIRRPRSARNRWPKPNDSGRIDPILRGDFAEHVGLKRDFESPTELMQPAREYDAPARRYRALARTRRNVSWASG